MVIAIPLSLLYKLPALVIEHPFVSDQLMLPIATGVLVCLGPFGDSVALTVLMGDLVLIILFLLFHPVSTQLALVYVAPRIAESIVILMNTLTLEYVIMQT